DAPRVREIEATHVVEGQDGSVAWGHSSSTAANTKEPFVWALAADSKPILGADQDGYFRITLVAPDRMEKCYVHNGTSPSRSIVAARDMMYSGNREDDVDAPNHPRLFLRFHPRSAPCRRSDRARRCPAAARLSRTAAVVGGRN